MAAPKKIGAMVLLLLVIGVAVAFGVRKTRLGGSNPTKWVLQQQVQRIDGETLELLAQTVGEWEKLGHKDGKYKNPTAGKYSMVDPMTCAACGETIPTPQMPPLPKDAPLMR